MRTRLLSLAASLFAFAACAPAPMSRSAAAPPSAPPPVPVQEEAPTTPVTPPPITAPDASPPPPPPAKTDSNDPDQRLRAHEEIDEKKEEKPKHEPSMPAPKGESGLRQAVASGSALSPDIVARVIKGHMPEIKGCYDRTLAAKPDTRGKVLLALTIDGTGKVTQTAIGQSSVPADLAQCVSERARNWTFPPPDGGGTIVVNYPFQFSGP